MSRMEIAKKAWKDGKMGAFTYVYLENHCFDDSTISGAVDRDWISRELGEELLSCEQRSTLEEKMDIMSYGHSREEVIDRKKFDGGDTAVYAEMSVTRDVGTNQIITGASGVYCNGLYQITETYAEAIEIAIKTADSLRHGKGYPTEFKGKI